MNNPENFQDSDLTIKLPKKGKGIVKMKRQVDKRLWDCERGCLMIICALPGSGKSTNILNLLAGENFMKMYYDTIHFIGATIEYDPTLKPLTDFYGNCHNDCSDAIINDIIHSQLEQDPEERTNCAVIIDDALSLPGFSSRKDSALSRLMGIHRHVLRGALPTEDNDYESNGGGLCIISTQRLWGSCPVNARTCADAIIIGRTANEEQLHKTIKEYAGMYGGYDQLKEMFLYCFQDSSHSFICLYLAGDMDPDHEGPVAYKDWAELIYPTPRFPKQEITLDTVTSETTNKIEL